MSYCRFSDADAYMYHNGEEIVCCSCRLHPPELFWSALIRGIAECYTDVLFESPAQAVNHLYKHREAGHYIPKYAIKQLKKEAKEMCMLYLDPEYQTARWDRQEDWSNFWSGMEAETDEEFYKELNEYKQELKRLKEIM